MDLTYQFNVITIFTFQLLPLGSVWIVNYKFRLTNTNSYGTPNIRLLRVSLCKGQNDVGSTDLEKWITTGSEALMRCEHQQNCFINLFSDIPMFSGCTVVTSARYLPESRPGYYSLVYQCNGSDNNSQTVISDAALIATRIA